MKVSGFFHHQTFQEAMYCGVATVAVDGYGCNELIINGVNGCLYPSGDINQLASKILKAIEHKKLGKRARNTIKRDFNSKNTAKQYLKLYEKLSNY